MWKGRRGQISIFKVLPQTSNRQIIWCSKPGEDKKNESFFFFFLAALAKQTPRHTDVWLLSDPSSTQPLTQDQETDPERFFRAGLTQTDVDFNEVGPTDCEHGSYTLQPIPPLIYRINTRATEVTMHQSRKKKKIHLTLEKDIFREHNSRVVMTAVTITEIQPLLPLALSVRLFTVCFMANK